MSRIPTILFFVSAFIGTVNLEGSNLTLWYDKPAAQWVEAMPIGNGHMGAMVFGGVNSKAIPAPEVDLSPCLVYTLRANLLLTARLPRFSGGG